MARTSASAAIAFSPPESSSTFWSRLPGGCATMSMPDSSTSSASMRLISPRPPPNSSRKNCPKLRLIDSKAWQKRSRERRLISRSASSVEMMPSVMSARCAVRNFRRSSFSASSSSAIMLTAPNDSMRARIAAPAPLRQTRGGLLALLVKSLALDPDLLGPLVHLGQRAAQRDEPRLGLGDLRLVSLQTRRQVGRLRLHALQLGGGGPTPLGRGGGGCSL